MNETKEVRQIYVHGWGTDKRVWGEVLPEGGVAIDLPSHGANSKWDEPTLAPGAAEVASFDNKGKPIVGVGWSLGAVTLIQAAIQYPAMFTALVLVGATPSFVVRDGAAWAQKTSVVKKMTADMEKNPAKTLKRFYDLNFTQQERESREAEDFLKLYSTPPASFDLNGINTALAALIKTDLRGALAGVKVPCLIVHGALDTIAPIGAARFMAENIKNSTLEVFDRAGHAPFITERKRFYNLLRDFIADI